MRSLQITAAARCRLCHCHNTAPCDKRSWQSTSCIVRQQRTWHSSVEYHPHDGCVRSRALCSFGDMSFAVAGPRVLNSSVWQVVGGCQSSGMEHAGSFTAFSGQLYAFYASVEYTFIWLRLQRVVTICCRNVLTYSVLLTSCAVVSLLQPMTIQTVISWQ